MNLKDLNKIDIHDLKNIDWRQAKAQLQSRPGLIINILLIGVTLFVVSSAYQKYARLTKSLGREAAELREKADALEKSRLTQKQYDDFLKSVPEVIPGDRMVETLAGFAVNRGVQILSFSPAKERSDNFIHLTNVEIHIASKDYANIILFMRDIETSPYSIRIGKWSGSSGAPEEFSGRRSRRPIRQMVDETVQKEHIEATVEIESVTFKHV